MKVVIFAGGLGSRLSEETESRPKPMVEIGGRPILWHIMKHYAHHGLKEFVIALGYRGEVIKRWFLDMAELDGSFTLSLGDRRVERHDRPLDDWKLSLIDTGVETQTGGRLARVAPLLRDGTFMLTYGDGLCDLDLGKLLAFHRAHGKLATVTAVRPPARFGELQFEGASRWSGWRRGASSWPTSTRASGSAWTPSARSACWTPSGPAAAPHGKCGPRIWCRKGEVER
jgi:glucose-1-phosphate cytidylyltransferase